MNDTRGSSRTSIWLVGAVLFGIVYAFGLLAMGRHLDSVPLTSLALGVGLVSASTGVARWVLVSRTVSRPVRRKRILLVGAGPVAEHLARLAEGKGYHVLGCVEDLDPDQRLEWPTAVLAPRAALPELALYLRADEILVADGQSKITELVAQIEREGIPSEVYVVPEAYELALCRPTSTRLGDVALFRLPTARPSGLYPVLKRVFDLAVSFLILAIFGPVLLLSMLAIKLTSPGPALFRQERVGKDGQVFEILKLRTMVVDAEKNGAQLCQGKHDPRLTPVGRILRKTHLDELPQLWNVLRGEMSLVGPRPERPCFVEQFERELPRYAERHRILPGIAGLAQINGYYHSSPREKLRFDLMYLYHPSLWMDVCILFRTFLKVFA